MHRVRPDVHYHTLAIDHLAREKPQEIGKYLEELTRIGDDLINKLNKPKTHRDLDEVQDDSQEEALTRD